MGKLKLGHFCVCLGSKDDENPENKIFLNGFIEKLFVSSENVIFHTTNSTGVKNWTGQRKLNLGHPGALFRVKSVDVPRSTVSVFLQKYLFRLKIL